MTEWYRIVFAFFQNQNQVTGFPERLILPKGTKDGQQLVLFVIVNKYKPSPNQNQNQNQALNIYQVQDNRAQGYPFDRQINNDSIYAYAPNAYFKEVTVYYQPSNEVNSAQWKLSIRL